MRVEIRVALLAAASAFAVWGQAVAGAGAVSGFVYANENDELPQVNVTVGNSALGVRRLAVTSDDGAFDITGLPPCPGYKVKVDLKGYVTWESPAFEVAVGQTQVLRINMHRQGDAGKTDTNGLMPRVELNKTGITTWITPQQTTSLPASERIVNAAAVLAPAVTADSLTGRVLFRGEASSNSFMDDGITTTSGYFGARPDFSNPLTLDTTQELQVLSSTYPAEFGRGMGGVVNAVTPVGGNSYHGAAFDYLRPSSFSSTERYSLGQNLLGQRNQFGVNAGGPIIHDQIFFFVNVEKMNDNFKGMNRITTQSLVDATGTTIPSYNCGATAAQCASAIKFIQSQMNVVEPLSEHWSSGLGDIVYRRSDMHSFNAEFNARNQKAPEAALNDLVAPNGGLLGLNNSTEDTRYAKVAWTYTPTPQMVSELHLGMFDDRWSDPPSTPGLSTGIIGITVAGAIVGNPNPNTEIADEKRYQLVENFTITSGSHTIRIGADISRTHDNVNMLQGIGTYNYPTLTAFAQDFSGGTTKSYTNFTQQFGTAAHRVAYRELNPYAQDTWRLTQRLNLNVGIRWDRDFLPQPSYANATYYQTGSIPASNIAFAPRASLAYMLNDTTVIRAGYGFFYAPYQGQMLDALLEGNGLSETTINVSPTQTGAPIFPRQLTFKTSPTGTSVLMYAQSKLRNPHTQEATLAIEKRVARSTTVTLNLVDSRTTKLYTGTDVNLPIPVKTGTYPIDNSLGAVVGSYPTINIYTARNDARYAQIYQVGNSGAAWYNAASLEVRHTMGHGLSVQGLYTWSKATGTQTGPLYDGVFPLTTYPGDFATDKGPLPTDQRHRAVINWIWQPVVTHSTSTMARYLANGWQISGIAQYTSGQPLTPTVLLTGNQFSGLTMDYYNSLNGSGGWARAAFASIGSLHTDAQRSVNARISRTLPFTERIQGIVAFEGFNLFNSQKITGLNTNTYTAVATLPVGLANGPYNGVLKPINGGGSGNASSAYPDGTTARQLQLSFRVVF